MIQNSKLSIAANVIKTVFNSAKKFDTTKISNLNKNGRIERHSPLFFSKKQLEDFRSFVKWNKVEIPPTFPYALLTHLHFSLVNDSRFPFGPLGLIHKKEIIDVLMPLTSGSWEMHCKLDSITAVENGYEIKIISELKIDGKFAWRSTTIAIKKTKNIKSNKIHDVPQVNSHTFWKIPNGNGRKYAMISNNIDPIHMGQWSAKLMGHRAAIMHGMWTAARGLSELEQIHYPFQVSFKFITPIYMPAEVVYQKEEQGFGVYSKDGKTVHLLATIA